MNQAGLAQEHVLPALAQYRETNSVFTYHARKFRNEGYVQGLQV